MILGLFSMGIVRNSSPSQTGGITYFKGAGIALTFAFTVLLLGGGLFTLFLTEFQNLAETSAHLLKTTSRPLGSIAVALIRFVFGRDYQEQWWLDAISDGASVTPQAGEGAGGGVLELIAAFLIIGLTITILLGFCFILYKIFNWLRSTTVEDKERPGIWKLLLSFIDAVKQLFWSLRGRMSRDRDGAYTAEKIYQNLLRWGRLSGLSHAFFETPQEYGIRLGRRFPRIEKEIRRIIHLHDEAIYGGVSPDSHQISRARLALRRIRNPFLWFARIKSLCFHNRF
jgi:hypothetical protein